MRSSTSESGPVPKDFGMLVPEGPADPEQIQHLPLPVNRGLPICVNLALTLRVNEAVLDYFMCLSSLGLGVVLKLSL